ncbi:MAG: glycosyltransferase [Desulfamplus sp.]|nr:glycosyltransferase [Desulfamplus sp.]
MWLFKRQIPINLKCCHTISVVIPTLNEEENIYSCVSKIICSPHIYEVIVVDGGSEDKTVELAKKAGATVLVHDKPYYSGGGRGGQIKAGIRKTSGDVVAIVHADTIISSKAFKQMITVLNLRPSVIGGSVGCRFENFSNFNLSDKPTLKRDSKQTILKFHRFKLNILEFLNDVRAVFFNISFGDQVQFFRREPVVRYDIFPDIPLMEDVEFSIRLNSLGDQVFLFGKAVVSARRWQRLGVKNIVMVISLLLKYLIKRFFKNSPDTSLFYSKYYSS